MYSFKVFHLVVRRNNKNVFPRAYLKAKTVGYRDHGGMSFNKPFNLDDTKKFQYSTVINILNLTVKLESCFQRLWWMKEWEKGWGRESERGYVSVYVRIVHVSVFCVFNFIYLSIEPEIWPPAVHFQRNGSASFKFIHCIHCINDLPILRFANVPYLSFSVPVVVSFSLWCPFPSLLWFLLFLCCRASGQYTILNWQILWRLSCPFYLTAMMSRSGKLWRYILQGVSIRI